MFSSQLLIGRLKAYAGKLTTAVSAIALSLFLWSGFAIATDLTANAETIQIPSVIATSGVADQAEGTAQKGIGSFRRNLGDTTGDTSEEAKGGIEQAKGEAKQNIGTAKNKLDDAKNAAEEKSENIIDSVKNFFE
ncbi:MAG TPA: CsbD family protein [Coleofasciculaceae cyanobacterium]|jgi:uncharacterized protein YjbJ (UPF0337 family)